MSTDSEHIEDRLSDYLDGALPPQEHLAAAQHIKICQACEAHFQELMRMRKMLHESPRLEPPESFYAGVLSRMKPRNPILSWFSTGFPLKTLASACLVMLVVWVTYEQRDRTKQIHLKSEPALGTPTPSPAPATVPTPALKSMEVQSDVALGEQSSASKQDIPPPPVPIEADGSGLALQAPAREDEQKALTQFEAPLPTERAAAGLSRPADRASVPKATSAKSVSGAKAKKSTLTKAPTSSAFTSRASRTSAPTDMLGKPKREGAKTTLVQFPTSQEKIRPKALVEWRGASSNIRKFRTYVVETPGKMKELWNKHAPGLPVPKVDFELYQVVGITSGKTHAVGFGFEIMGTRDTPETTIVYYRAAKDFFKSKTDSANYRPYHFKVIPKTNLPVKFQKI